MRFIKDFKLFESMSDEISNKIFESNDIAKETVEDLLRDLSDNDIPVDVYLNTYPFPVNISGCAVTLGTAPMFVVNRDIFIPSDYKDVFLRVFDYMELEGYELSSLMYEFKGEIQTLRITNTGLGIDAISNQLFNGIDETCYLKLYFRKR